MGRWAQLHRLVPAFFARFFESELTAGPDDRKTTFFALLAILAMPGFMLPLLLASASLPVPAASGVGTDSSGWGWSMIAHYQGPEALRAVSRPDKVLYLGFAMIASGIVSLIAWNTLLIDRRDRVVLDPLPLYRSTVVIAKLVALLGYIFLIAVAMHALASFAFGIALAANNTVTFAGRGIAAHLIASVGANLFVMLSVVAVQGVTLAAVGPRWFARVSPLLQLCLVFLVISAVLSLPSIAGSVNGVLGAGSGEAHVWILMTPPLWFLGMYERLLGTSNAALLGLAHTASFAMALTAAAACGSYVLASRRVHASLADSDVVQVRRSTRAITVLTGAMGRDPQIRAAARFFLTTVARSHRHRLVMASAIGVAAAWGLPAWLALSSRAEAPQLASLSSVLTATMFMLVGLRISAWIPTDLRAAWTFELASLPRWTSRLAVERAMFALVLLPSVTLSSLTYWWLWGSRVALLHALFALAAGSLLIQTLLWSFDGVPCTRRWDRDVLRLRHSWLAYLAVLVTLAPGFAGLELLLLSRPLACLCTVGYMLTLAHSVRVASRARPGAVATDPVDVLTAALRSARLSPDLPREDTQAPAAAQPVEPSVLQRDQIERVTLHEALPRLRPPHVLRDVRFAFRRLAGAPVFTVFSVLTLGCGVGITTSVYSVVQTALWTSPPVADIDRLLHLEPADGRSPGHFRCRTSRICAAARRHSRGSPRPRCSSCRS